jgi:hypothetical protein
MHANEKVDIRDQLTKGIQLAQRMVSTTQQVGQFRVSDDPFMTNRLRQKSPVLVAVFIDARLEVSDIPMSENINFMK